MDERLERLQGLIDSQQSAFKPAAIGTIVDVLFERPPRAIPARSSAAPLYLQPAHVCLARHHRTDPPGTDPKPPNAKPVSATSSRSRDHPRSLRIPRSALEPEPLPKSASDSPSLAPAAT